MKAMLVAAALVTAGAASVRADPAPAPRACDAEIQKTQAEWDSLHLPRTKPGAMSRGAGQHAHVQAELDTLNYHMRDAKRLCEAGRDHDALLHLDVVRAVLRLPEIQHPAEHHYGGHMGHGEGPHHDTDHP